MYSRKFTLGSTWKHKVSDYDSSSYYVREGVLEKGLTRETSRECTLEMCHNKMMYYIRHNKCTQCRFFLNFNKNDFCLPLFSLPLERKGES